MTRYVIRTQQMPERQHPQKYLEVICENEGEDRDLLWVMDQYQRNRNAMRWDIVEGETREVSNVEGRCEQIKYKFDEGDPIA